MNFYKRLIQHLKAEEGFRQHAYECSRDTWTIGYGTTTYLDGSKVNQLDQISTTAAEGLLRYHAFQACQDAAEYFEEFESLSPQRRLILVSMAYQMGLNRLKGFVQTHAALMSENWTWAAEEMLDSRWARDDSPDRARRLANAMEYDSWVANAIPGRWSG